MAAAEEGQGIRPTPGVPSISNRWRSRGNSGSGRVILGSQVKDPKHGRTIFLGRDMAQALRVWFAKIGLHVARQMEHGRRPNWQQFVLPMVQAFQPYMLKYFRAGAALSWRRVLVALAKRRLALAEKSLTTPEGRGAWLHTKRTPDSTPALMGAFDVLLPQVQAFIEQMTFAFVQETLETAASQAAEAYEELRQELAAGVEVGESLKKITARVQGVFTDPARAFGIAATETSRSMHAGQVEAAKQSKIVTKLEWLASSDACPECLKLDGKQVEIGQPFSTTASKNPRYAVVYHPGLHPHCMCAMNEIID